MNVHTLHGLYALAAFLWLCGGIWIMLDGTIGTGKRSVVRTLWAMSVVVGAALAVLYVVFRLGELL